MFDNEFKWIKSVAVYEGKLYCAPGGARAIYRIDMGLWKVDKIIRLPYKTAGYWNLFIYKERIFCAPHIGRMIYETDAELTYLCEIVRDNDEQELVDVILERDELFFVPRKLPDNMWKYSFATKEMSIVRFWKKENVALEITGRMNRWFTKNNSILFIIYSLNRIFEYNFFENKMREIILSNMQNWHDAVYWGDNLCAVNRDAANIIFRFDDKFSEIQEICVQSDEVIKKIVPLNKDSLLIEMETFLAVYNSGEFVKILTGIEKSQGSFFLQSVCVGDYFVLMPWASDLFVKISHNYKNIETYQFERFAKEIIDDKSIWNESEIKLDAFIAAI